MTMDEKHLKEDIEQIEKELASDEYVDKKFPWGIVGAIVIGILIIFMVIPEYAIKLDPEPKYIPKLEEVFPRQNMTAVNIAAERSRHEINSFLEPNNPVVKRAADRIISLSKCPADENCYAKAIFYFVRDRIQYVSDPPDDYIKSFDEMMMSPVGDCDDKSLLLANLLQSVGIHTKFVVIPEHVYVVAYLPESLKKYHDKEIGPGWVNLDATCEYCAFGEIPILNQDKVKQII